MEIIEIGRKMLLKAEHWHLKPSGLEALGKLFREIGKENEWNSCFYIAESKATTPKRIVIGAMAIRGIGTMISLPAGIDSLDAKLANPREKKAHSLINENYGIDCSKFKISKESDSIELVEILNFDENAKHGFNWIKFFCLCGTLRSATLKQIAHIGNSKSNKEA